MTTSDNENKELNAVAPHRGRPYEKPTVVDFGSVQELTEANPGSPNEAGGRTGNRGGKM